MACHRCCPAIFFVDSLETPRFLSINTFQEQVSPCYGNSLMLSASGLKSCWLSSLLALEQCSRSLAAGKPSLWNDTWARSLSKPLRVVVDSQVVCFLKWVRRYELISGQVQAPGPSHLTKVNVPHTWTSHSIAWVTEERDRDVQQVVTHIPVCLRTSGSHAGDIWVSSRALHHLLNG